MKNTRCCIGDSACTAGNFSDILSLGELPLGNPVGEDRKEGAWKGEFVLSRCNQCGCIQTNSTVPDEELRREAFYVSAHTQAIVTNYQRQITNLESNTGITKESKILEVGCGDGLLLNLFYEKGYRNLLGVEPNSFPEKYPVEIIRDFFNDTTPDLIRSRNFLPGLVICNSVIETIPGLQSFFRNVSSLMKPGTFMFVEVPYLPGYLDGKRLDAFSHLTANWFTAESIASICKAWSFDVHHFVIDDQYRGGSMLITLRKRMNEKSMHSADFLKILTTEKTRFENGYFRNLDQETASLRKRIKESVDSLNKEGYLLVGYGGGLKAATTLNWLGLNSQSVSFAVDRDKYKHGKFIPGTGIPIKPLEELTGEGKIAVIVFALHYLEEVLAYLKSILSRDARVIIPLPEPQIISMN